MAQLKTVDGNIGDGHFLMGPYDPNLSGESIVLAATTVALPAGTVLGRVTANGQYKPLDPAAVDGTQNFAGILYGRREISTGIQRAAAVVRHAVVNYNLLSWVVAATDPQRNTAIAAAAAAQVMIRR